MGEIQVHVHYFAMFREAAGRSDETWSLSTFKTPAALFQKIIEKYPLSLTMQHVRVAVNDELVPTHTELQDNDHVVFIPPVSGG